MNEFTMGDLIRMAMGFLLLFIGSAVFLFGSMWLLAQLGVPVWIN